MKKQEKVKIVNKIDFKIDFKKVKTINDIKLLLEGMDLVYTPKSEEFFERVKHLLKKN